MVVKEEMIINEGIKIGDSNKCTGCGLCTYLCPKHAISFSLQGLHDIPTINKTLCVNCGKCINNCPTNSPVIKNFIQNCYAAWSRDDEIHKNCSSGGLATELYLSCIKNGWYVVGCAYDKNIMPKYVATNDLNDLSKFRGSKYVSPFFPLQTYSQIDNFISQKKNILFIGLPCHCAALRQRYKNNQYLYLIDLLCRGSNSYKLFNEYIAFRRKKVGKIYDVSFRGGENDCSICLWGKDHKLLYRGEQYRDEYFFTFMKHSALRLACYSCQYAGSRRIGDITLGDFWGLDDSFIKEHDVKNGVNLLLVNTSKGKFLLDSIANRIEYYKRPVSEAVAGNDTLSRPTQKPADYDFISLKYQSVGLFNAVHKYDEDYFQMWYAQNRSLQYVVKSFLRKILPLFAINFYHKVKK